MKVDTAAAAAVSAICKANFVSARANMGLWQEGR